MKNRYARPSDLLYHTYQFFECYLKKQSLQNMKLFLLLVVYKACLEIKCICKMCKAVYWVEAFAKSFTRAPSNNELAVKRKGWKINILH